MDTQQLIALGLVGLASVYLGRGFIASARNFFAQKSGCGGCGKCSFAQGMNDKGMNDTGKPQRAVRHGTLIPLIDVRAEPPSRPK
jgi:hypothetical protein